MALDRQVDSLDNEAATLVIQALVRGTLTRVDSDTSLTSLDPLRDGADVLPDACVDETPTTYVGEDFAGRRVSAGSKETLIQVLLNLKETACEDQRFMRDFILTYDHFITGEELISQLRLFYESTWLNEAEAPAHVIKIYHKGLRDTRFRVLDVIGEWVQRRPYDFQCPDLDALLRSFLLSASAVAGRMYPDVAKYANLLASATLDELDRPVVEVVEEWLDGPLPTSSWTLQRNAITLNLKSMAWKSREMATLQLHTGLGSDALVRSIPSRTCAEGLCIFSHGLITKIPSTELLFLGSDPSQEELLAVAPHLSESLNFSNKVSSWAMNEILRQETAPSRVHVATYMANTAKACLDLNNFDSAQAMYFALMHSSISRLEGMEESHVEKICKPLADLFTDFSQIKTIKAQVFPFLASLPSLIISSVRQIIDGQADR